MTHEIVATKNIQALHGNQKLMQEKISEQHKEIERLKSAVAALNDKVSSLQSFVSSSISNARGSGPTAV